MGKSVWGSKGDFSVLLKFCLYNHMKCQFSCVLSERGVQMTWHVLLWLLFVLLVLYSLAILILIIRKKVSYCITLDTCI